MMMLVIDITKGIQTQTAECLIIGEITCSKMLVVLNKIDLIPSEKRQSTIDKVYSPFNSKHLINLQNLKLQKFTR